MFHSLCFLLICAATFEPIAMSSDIEVTYEEYESLTRSDKALLIDVRNPEELIETGTIPNTINIPLPELEHVLTTTDPADFLKKYGKNKPELDTLIVFSCKSGIRSLKAVGIAQKLGYTNVKHFPGGWLEWEARHKQTTPTK